MDPAKQFEAREADFDNLAVLTSPSDTLISRSGNFHADDNDGDRWDKLIALPLAHACGVISC